MSIRLGRLPMPTLTAWWAVSLPPTSVHTSKSFLQLFDLSLLVFDLLLLFFDGVHHCPKDRIVVCYGFGDDLLDGLRAEADVLAGRFQIQRVIAPKPAQAVE